MSLGCLQGAAVKVTRGTALECSEIGNCVCVLVGRKAKGSLHPPQCRCPVSPSAVGIFPQSVPAAAPPMLGSLPRSCWKQKQRETVANFAIHAYGKIHLMSRSRCPEQAERSRSQPCVERHKRLF